MPGSDTASKVERSFLWKSMGIRIALTLLGLYLIWLIVRIVADPQPLFARTFLDMVSYAAFAAALIASAWTVYVHGDLKQRSDTSVSLAIFGVLRILLTVAGGFYIPDWEIATNCPADPSFSPDCANEHLMLVHRLNAQSLDQILGLFAFGQIVPLLSIMKDVVYSWRKPTPWDEVELRDYREFRDEDVPVRGKVWQFAPKPPPKDDRETAYETRKANFRCRMGPKMRAKFDYMDRWALAFHRFVILLQTRDDNDTHY